jgi:hypothetical protein
MQARWGILSSGALREFLDEPDLVISYTGSFDFVFSVASDRERFAQDDKVHGKRMI